MLLIRRVNGGGHKSFDVFLKDEKQRKCQGAREERGEE